MILTLALKALERAMNHAIQLDGAHPTKLAKLDNEKIKLFVEGPDITFYLVFSASAVQVKSTLLGEPTLEIRATPVNLARIFCEADTQQLLSRQLIDIRGNFGTAIKLGEFFKSLEMDWPRCLAPIIGETWQGAFSRYTQGFKQSLKRKLATFDQDVQEYTQQETQQIPKRDQFEQFKQAVATLRDNVARLEARLGTVKK